VTVMNETVKLLLSLSKAGKTWQFPEDR